MAPSLTERVQALPQELIDTIHDYTFTAEKSIRVNDKDYKPPARLQVDRVSREQFAWSYFGDKDAIFQTKGLPVDKAVRWVASLKRRHRKLIHKLRYEAGPLFMRNGEMVPQLYGCGWAMEKMDEFRSKLFRRGVGLQKGVVAVDERYRGTWDEEEKLFIRWTERPGHINLDIEWEEDPEQEDVMIGVKRSAPPPVQSGVPE